MSVLAIIKGIYFAVGLVLALLLWSVMALAAVTLAPSPPGRIPLAIISTLLVAEVAGFVWLIFRYRHQLGELIKVTSAALWILNIVNITGVVLWHPTL